MIATATNIAGNSLQVLSFAGGQEPEGNRQRPLHSLPALFPATLLGAEPRTTPRCFLFTATCKHRLFRDKIFFVMFPLYSQTRKKDMVTDNYLCPFFDTPPRRRPARLAILAAGRERAQGRDHADQRLRRGENHRRPRPVSSRSGRFYCKRPGIGTDDPQRAAVAGVHSCLRLRLRSPQRDSTTVIWPFFNYGLMTAGRNITNGRRRGRSSSSRAAKARRPARLAASTAARTTPPRRAISISGRFTSSTMSTRLRSTAGAPASAFSCIPNTDGEEHRDREATTAGRCLAVLHLSPRFQRQQPAANPCVLLEPFLPDNRSIERDCSPLWSLWRSENNPQTGATSQSLLWNLYRHETTPRRQKMLALVRAFPVSIVQGRGQSRKQVAAVRASRAVTVHIPDEPHARPAKMS